MWISRLEKSPIQNISKEKKKDEIFNTLYSIGHEMCAVCCVCLVCCLLSAVCCVCVCVSCVHTVNGDTKLKKWPRYHSFTKLPPGFSGLEF